MAIPDAFLFSSVYIFLARSEPIACGDGSLADLPRSTIPPRWVDCPPKDRKVILGAGSPPAPFL